MSVTNTASSSAGVYTAKAFGEISNGTDTFKKAASVAIDIMTIVLDILGFIPGVDGVSGFKEGLVLLRDQFKMTKVVINGTAIVGMCAEWCDPEGVKSNTKNTAKLANRVTMTVALAMEFVAFIDKFTAKFFSQPALCVGGTIPIFELVKNSIWVISAGFGVWAACIDKDEGELAIEIGKAKKRKWEARGIELGDLDKFKFDQVQTKYQDKLDAISQVEEKDKKALAKEKRYQEFLAILNKKKNPEDFKAVVNDFQAAKVKVIYDNYCAKEKAIVLKNELEPYGSFDAKINEFKKDLEPLKLELESKKDSTEAAEHMLAMIKEKNDQINALKRDKAKVEKYHNYETAINKGNIKKLVDHKIEKADALIQNGDNKITKSWISIAAEVGKIFMIVVGTILLGLSLIFPVLKGPAVTMTMNCCGLVTNSFGLAKNIYRDVFYEANLVKIPQFSAVAA